MRRHSVFCLAALSGLLSTPYVATASDTSGKVLFVSNRDGNAQVYVMNANGSGQQALTVGPAENTEPAWSSDGKRIAFTSYRDGNADIYVMDADGTNQKRLTNDRRSDNVPAWTVDGRIVFRSMRDRNANFFIMDADGGNLKRITDDKLDKAPPVPSPDGSRLAFVAFSLEGDRHDIHVVGQDGVGLKNLTAELSKDKKLAPAWSADGKSIAYMESKGYALNLRLIDVETGKVSKVTEDASATFANAVWSPDGRRIAYVSSPAGSAMDKARGDIYVMNADGSGVKNLTANPAEDNYPAWSADGTSIYFVSFRDGNAQIYSVTMDGATEVRLTRNAGQDLMLRPHHARPKSPISSGLGMAVATNSHSSDHIKE